jgi:hypothetical protein
MMRFDSTEHVRAWVARRQYPAIHNDIFTAVQTFSTGTSGLDLCCSTGLLGSRVAKQLRVPCIGVDVDKDAVEFARLAGVPMAITIMPVTPDTLEQLVGIVKDAKVDMILARRCFPELFGSNRPFGEAFAKAMHGAGVKEIFIEGRVPVAKPINSLDTLKKEVELMSPYFKATRAHRNVAYLKRA